jgi:hypothetical protein
MSSRFSNNCYQQSSSNAWTCPIIKNAGDYYTVTGVHFPCEPLTIYNPRHHLAFYVSPQLTQQEIQQLRCVWNPHLGR